MLERKRWFGQGVPAIYALFMIEPPKTFGATYVRAAKEVCNV